MQHARHCLAVLLVVLVCSIAVCEAVSTVEPTVCLPAEVLSTTVAKMANNFAQDLAVPCCCAVAPNYPLDSTQASARWRYAVIIDAGSSGSRAHVFRYTPPQQPSSSGSSSSADAYPTIELPKAVHRTSPGLSAYAFDPRAAANSLQPLLAFARQGQLRLQAGDCCAGAGGDGIGAA